MNKLLRTLACAALLAASAAAQATHYEFSYTMASGTKITGDFDGTAHDNLISGLSDFSVFIDGSAFAGNGSMLIFPVVGYDPVVSFDGTATNFLLLGTTELLYIAPLNGGSTDSVGYRTPGVNTSEGDGDYSAARWHVTAVPEPATAAMMLGGLALVGAVARRRRRATPIVR
ncbi:PEPxxWA-CTERM sorting domain-containing protein [Duganella sp. FT80W]|uniref:PEPxxWA-CTERM sorting domain-containing protein n=1 Tax=Duganella guangzhouensis TaxID=2666084 RepID=A0A6I2KYH2_9BURK|nr:PEPxxWA-CTERM sorting domain-containing protein [Duganella guangzhouensis]MRW90773.1 PEPxxWA-CTERM sorting domain-containing protein [Duganella guangzhouensis]